MNNTILGLTFPNYFFIAFGLVIFYFIIIEIIIIRELKKLKKYTIEMKLTYTNLLKKIKEITANGI